MRIPLVSTWREIAAYLLWKPDPLGILRIVNLVSLRSWHFHITFGVGERLRLRVRADPALTPYEIAALLSGHVPELFFCDLLTVNGDGGSSLEFRPRTRWESQIGSTDVNLEGSWRGGLVNEVVMDGFFGNAMPVQLQSQAEIRARLDSHTRFGSHKYRNFQVKVEWNVLGQEFGFQIVSRLETIRTRSRKAFEKELFLGEKEGPAFLLTTSELECSEVFHSDYGVIDLAEYEPSVGELRGLNSNWLIELVAPSLEVDALGKLGPRQEVQALIKSIGDRIRDLCASVDFERYRDAVEQQELAEAARRLVVRQARARQGEYVYWRDRILMKLPSSENELVALYMKLEALNAIPVHQIRVAEYTPRAGIDALADYQRQSFEQRQMLVPVEFEHLFENFLRHEHPESQVRVVICWDFENEPPELLPGSQFRQSSLGEWLSMYSRHNYHIDVIRISKLPGLVIKPWSNP